MANSASLIRTVCSLWLVVPSRNPCRYERRVPCRKTFRWRGGDRRPDNSDRAASSVSSSFSFSKACRAAWGKACPYRYSTKMKDLRREDSPFLGHVVAAFRTCCVFFVKSGFVSTSVPAPCRPGLSPLKIRGRTVLSVVVSRQNRLGQKKVFTIPCRTGSWRITGNAFYRKIPLILTFAVPRSKILTVAANMGFLDFVAAQSYVRLVG